MADIVMATALLLGGAGWSFVCLMAYASHPIPGQADLGFVAYLGPLAALAGLAWWAWLIYGWLT